MLAIVSMEFIVCDDLVGLFADNVFFLSFSPLFIPNTIGMRAFFDSNMFGYI